jgi:predicted Zn-dependent protease
MPAHSRPRSRAVVWTALILAVLVAGTIPAVRWLLTARPTTPSGLQAWSRAGGGQMLRALEADARAVETASPALLAGACGRLGTDVQDAQYYDAMPAGPASGAWQQALGDLQAAVSACRTGTVTAMRADAGKGGQQVADVQDLIH